MSEIQRELASRRTRMDVQARRRHYWRALKQRSEKYMTSASIVVVTGANRGIGFEISRQLANRGAEVILTARKPEVGKAAVKKLAAQNLTMPNSKVPSLQTREVKYRVLLHQSH